MTFKVNTHQLVSKHQKVSDSEKKSLFGRYNIDYKSLPRISREDPAIIHLNLKHGEIVKIERESKTAGRTAYYRVVVDG